MAESMRDVSSLSSQNGVRPPHFITPVITEQDLVAFHDAHFLGFVKPSAFFADPAAASSCLPEEQEEDDGLGYYPDGVKRTLTDAQIELFRHSERMQIERADRLRREEAQRVADQVDEAQSGKPDEPARSQRTGTPTAQISSGTAPEPEPIITLKQGRSDRKEVPYQQRNKRKWEGYIKTEDPRHGSMTHRRMARELDEQQADSIDIDYG